MLYINNQGKLLKSSGLKPGGIMQLLDFKTDKVIGEFTESNLLAEEYKRVDKVYIARLLNGKIEIKEHEIMGFGIDSMTIKLETCSANVMFLEIDNIIAYKNEVRSFDRDKAIDLLIKKLEFRIESLIQTVEEVSNAIISFEG